MNDTSPCYPIEDRSFHHSSASALSPEPLFSFVFISSSCTGSHLYSLFSSNEFFLICFSFLFPSQLSLVLTLPLFPFLFSFFSGLLSSHPLGCWRMWISLMSQATGGLLEVNKREAAVLSGVLHMHARAHTHVCAPTHIRLHTHIPAKLSNFPQRTRLPEGKMPQKEKQRGGIFSVCPPLSISFEPPCLLLPPLVVLCSAAQSCRVIKESSALEARDKLNVCGRRDEKGRQGNKAVNQKGCQTFWGLSSQWHSMPVKGHK